MSRNAENARVKAHLNTHLKFRDYFDWESHFWFVKIVNKDKRNIDFDSQTLFMWQNCRMFFSIEVVPDPDDVAVQLVWDVLAIISWDFQLNLATLRLKRNPRPKRVFSF